MSTQQVEESPGQTTAGLTSAEQLTDVTGAITFDINNTTSLIPKYFPSPAGQPEKIPVMTSRKTRFAKALRASIRHNLHILDKLAKH